jgi:hypothetical protein
VSLGFWYTILSEIHLWALVVVHTCGCTQNALLLVITVVRSQYLSISTSRIQVCNKILQVQLMHWSGIGAWGINLRSLKSLKYFSTGL